MASSGVTVSPECVSAFNDLKLGKSTKWIIYKLSDNQKEVVVEESGKEQEWETFREKLINAKSADGKTGARYAVYDLSYEAEGGAGQRNKIVFIAWSPDTAGIKVKPGPGAANICRLTCHTDQDGVLLLQGCPQARTQRCSGRDSSQRRRRHRARQRHSESRTRRSFSG